MYTIREIYEKTGLSTHTLRFYEKEGLIKPNRDKNNRRQYDDVHLLWITFICKMRDAHMSLAKIKSYQEFYIQGDETVDLRRDLLEEHLTTIQKEIETLKEIERYFIQKIDDYTKKYNA